MPAVPKDSYAPYWVAYRDWLAALIQQACDATSTWQEAADFLGIARRKLLRDVAMLRRFNIRITSKNGRHRDEDEHDGGSDATDATDDADGTAEETTADEAGGPSGEGGAGGGSVTADGG